MCLPKLKLLLMQNGCKKITFNFKNSSEGLQGSIEGKVKKKTYEKLKKKFNDHREQFKGWLWGNGEDEDDDKKGGDDKKGDDHEKPKDSKSEGES